MARLGFLSSEVSGLLCFCQGFVVVGGGVLKILTSYIFLLSELCVQESGWIQQYFGSALIKDLIGSLSSLLKKTPNKSPF